MKLIFLGPPGAGKGTMAAQLAEHAGIPHISTGDIIRAAIRSGSPLGIRVKKVVESGGLVPDELTIGLVEDRLQQKDAANGFILDGFPRTIPQADALRTMTEIDKVINFSLSEDEIIKRLSGRRIHASSGRTYHVIFNPPKKEGLDDVTGEPLIIRPDDQVDSIRNRLSVYVAQTEPLIEYYTKSGILVDLDASPAPDEVFESLKKLVAQR